MVTDMADWYLCKPPFKYAFGLGADGIGFIEEAEEGRWVRCIKFNDFQVVKNADYQSFDIFRSNQWSRTESTLGPLGVIRPQTSASNDFFSLLDVNQRGIICFYDKLYLSNFVYYTWNGDPDTANQVIDYGFEFVFQPVKVQRMDYLQHLLERARCGTAKCIPQNVVEFPCVTDCYFKDSYAKGEKVKLNNKKTGKLEEVTAEEVYKLKKPVPVEVINSSGKVNGVLERKIFQYELYHDCVNASINSMLESADLFRLAFLINSHLRDHIILSFLPLDKRIVTTQLLSDEFKRLSAKLEEKEEWQSVINAYKEFITEIITPGISGVVQNAQFAYALYFHMLMFYSHIIFLEGVSNRASINKNYLHNLHLVDVVKFHDQVKYWFEIKELDMNLDNPIRHCIPPFLLKSNTEKEEPNPSESKDPQDGVLPGVNGGADACDGGGPAPPDTPVSTASAPPADDSGCPPSGSIPLDTGDSEDLPPAASQPQDVDMDQQTEC